MKRIRRLTLNRETLGQMDTPIIIGGNDDSCVYSCYLVSCEGGCTISTGQTSD